MSFRYQEVFDPMLAALRAAPPAQPPEPREGVIQATRYTSDEVTAQERSLIERSPIIVGASTQLPNAGSCFSHDSSEVPLLATRDASGRAHVFLNACRHRGTRLLGRGEAACSKAMVCPYHAWTYSHDGALQHVPRGETFRELPVARRALVEVPSVEHAGLIWAQPRGAAGSAIDLVDRLGPLADELTLFDLDDHVVFREARREHACDWKLLIEAFLDAYHIQFLHKSSIARFFGAPRTAADKAGDHVRSLTARKQLDDAQHGADPRSCATLSYVVFPNTVLIFHPDWVSVVTVFPTRAGHHLFDHKALVPRDALAKDPAHFERSFELIDDVVFRQEDLAACESVQGNLAAGVVDSCYFGQLESPALWFHDALARRSDEHA